MSVPRCRPIPGRGLVLRSLLLVLIGCSSAREPRIAAEEPALESELMLALADWRELPYQQGVRYAAATSTDRGEIPFEEYPVGNKDFNNVVAACARPALRAQHQDAPELCDEGLEGYVIAAADDGPGLVSRLFLTGLSFKSERLRVYADDLTRPVLDQALSSWRAGRDAPLVSWTSGALISYLPIAYRSRLRVVLDGVKPAALVYAQVSRNRGAPDVDFGRGVPSSAITEPLAYPGPEPATEPSEARELALEPGSHERLFETDEGGTLQRLKLALSPPSLETLSSIRLLIHWDDASRPAIDLPLSELFGQRHGLASFTTVAMSVQVGADQVELSLSVPMPFAERARLDLVHEGEEQRIDVRAQIEISPDAVGCEAGRLHAVGHAQRAPFQPDERLRVAALSGRGKYLGTLLCARGGADEEAGWPFAFSFLEGDDRTWVDGELIAHGTGTEDYFNAGWYFQDGEYSAAYSALISRASDEDDKTGSACMLRWHLLSDSIEFERSLTLDFEYGNDAPRTAHDYASVAFYYLQPECSAVR